MADAASLVARTRAAAADAFPAPGSLGLFACCCVLGLSSSFVAPFLSLWGLGLVGMRPIVFASFMTLNSLSAMVSSTLLARWSDTRWSRRSVLLLGGVGGALGYLGYAFVRHHFALMLIGVTAMSVSTIGVSQIFAQARQVVSRCTPARSAAFSLSVMRAAFSLSWTIGPALGALLVQHFGYRGSFLSASLLSLAYVGLVLAFVPAEPLESAANVHVAHEPLWRLLTRRSLLVNFLAFVLFFSAASLNMMNLPLFITNELAGSEQQVGTAFAIAPIFEIPFMLGLGRLSTPRQQTNVIRLGVLFGAVYFLGLGWAQAPLHVYPAQILMAFAIAVTMSLAIPYFQDLLPGQTGLATNLHASAWRLGSLLGYFCFGLLLERLGHRGLTRLCCGLAALSLLVLLLERQKHSTAN